MQQRAHRRRGFTLIELLVVIAIIGLLATAATVAVGRARMRARDARRISDLTQLQKALELYYNDRGEYPPSAMCPWSSWSCWASLLPVSYMSKVPVDPSNVDIGDCQSTPNCYIYRYCNLGSGFVLSANLERPPEQPQGNNPRCMHGGPNWYWVER